MKWFRKTLIRTRLKMRTAIETPCAQNTVPIIL